MSGLRDLAAACLIGLFAVVVCTNYVEPMQAQESKPVRRPLIVAHRGASHDAPENTLAAFKLAWEQGADAIEGDFYLSADGRIVCSHDQTTKKRAGVDRDVTKSTLAELKQLDVGSWKGESYRGERMPTLEEVLAIVPPDKTILIEIKCGPEIVPVLKTTLAQSKLKPAQTIVIAFDEHVVAATKQQIPGIKAYWLAGYKKNESGKFEPVPGEVIKTLQQIGADGLDSQANTDVVDESFVKMLRDAGMEFHVWTVNEPDVAARFQALGVDSITTDRPEYLRSQLK